MEPKIILENPDQSISNPNFYQLKKKKKIK